MPRNAIQTLPLEIIQLIEQLGGDRLNTTCRSFYRDLRNTQSLIDNINNLFLEINHSSKDDINDLIAKFNKEDININLRRLYARLNHLFTMEKKNITTYEESIFELVVGRKLLGNCEEFIRNFIIDDCKEIENPDYIDYIAALIVDNKKAIEYIATEERLAEWLSNPEKANQIACALSHCRSVTEIQQLTPIDPTSEPGHLYMRACHAILGGNITAVKDLFDQISEKTRLEITINYHANMLTLALSEKKLEIFDLLFNFLEPEQQLEAMNKDNNQILCDIANCEHNIFSYFWSKLPAEFVLNLDIKIYQKILSQAILHEKLENAQFILSQLSQDQIDEFIRNNLESLFDKSARFGRASAVEFLWKMASPENKKMLLTTQRPYPGYSIRTVLQNTLRNSYIDIAKSLWEKTLCLPLVNRQELLMASDFWIFSLTCRSHNKKAIDLLTLLWDACPAESQQTMIACYNYTGFIEACCNKNLPVIQFLWKNASTETKHTISQLDAFKKLDEELQHDLLESSEKCCSDTNAKEVDSTIELSRSPIRAAI